MNGTFHNKNYIKKTRDIYNLIENVGWNSELKILNQQINKYGYGYGKFSFHQYLPLIISSVVLIVITIGFGIKTINKIQN